ncbi:MAG TPA: pyridine nucleotide-disulfide oxidoreductase, partial [Syntrophomonas wolfei]|nr:pyridine nucleotide-disulfide oxidoreductase [Syntrophomonas wolfei]
LEGIFTLRTVHDSLAIKAYLNQHKPKRALIAGGGYIGLEMVENLLEYGCEVILLERSSHLLPNMDEDMALILTAYLQSRGVEVRTSENLSGFAGDFRVREAFTDKGSLPVDFVLLSMGVVPNSELAAAAGVELGIRNAIRVNDRMESNLPGIYAAGDCATTKHLVSGQEVYIPMGTTANKQGKVAGENAAGGNARFAGVLGTGIVRAMEMELSRTGLCENECRQLGIDFISRRVKSRTAAHYCPVSGEIHVKILVEEPNGRILGAQIVGFAGAAKRIDMLATAITMRATVESLIDMDLAYSPPFSPVWDPVLVALNQF